MLELVVCVVVLLIGLALFFRISGTDTNCITRSVSGLLDAAKAEFTSTGGKTGKVNLALSVMLLGFLVLLCIPDVLGEIRALLTGVPENNSFRFVLVAVLLIFFLISLCLVKSNEEFIKRMGKRD